MASEKSVRSRLGLQSVGRTWQWTVRQQLFQAACFRGTRPLRPQPRSDDDGTVATHAMRCGGILPRALRCGDMLVGGMGGLAGADFHGAMIGRRCLVGVTSEQDWAFQNIFKQYDVVLLPCGLCDRLWILSHNGCRSWIPLVCLIRPAFFTLHVQTYSTCRRAFSVPPRAPRHRLRRTPSTPGWRRRQNSS